MHVNELLQDIINTIPQDCKSFVNKPITMYKDMFGLYYVIFATKTDVNIKAWSEYVASNSISAFFVRRKYFK